MNFRNNELDDEQADGFAHLPAWGSSPAYDDHRPDEEDFPDVPAPGGTAWDEHDDDELAPY